MQHSSVPVTAIPERPWVRVLPLEPSAQDGPIDINRSSASNNAQCKCCLFCHAKTPISTHPLPVDQSQIVCSFCSGHCGKLVNMPLVIPDLDLLQIQLQISMQMLDDYQQQQLKQLFYQIGKSCS